MHTVANIKKNKPHDIYLPTSSVLWTEVSETGDGKGYIMAADTRTGLARSVLGAPGATNSRTRRSSDVQSACSCSDKVDVAPVLAMSYKPQDGATELFFVDKSSNTIFSTDLEGCNCFAVFQPDSGEDLGKWTSRSTAHGIDTYNEIEFHISFKPLALVFRFMFDVSIFQYTNTLNRRRF